MCGGFDLLITVDLLYGVLFLLVVVGRRLDSRHSLSLLVQYVDIYSTQESTLYTSMKYDLEVSRPPTALCSCT